jgi:hypothetical protein
VQHVVADDDVEPFAKARCAQRGEIALPNVAARAEAPDCVRARLDADVFEMWALAPERGAPESLAASDVERVACTAPEQLFGEGDDRAGYSCTLARRSNAMPGVTVPAIVVRLAEAVGQLALRGISTRSGVELCTLSR